MELDLTAARDFMATHARVLDRRRFAGDTRGALLALDGYRNADGGYGWGLEPDLRSPESQPGAALHAFEVFAEAGKDTSPHAAALCDWLESITLPDGGLPFALPLAYEEGTAPWWRGADPGVSALQITSISAAAAHHVAAHDPAVAAHPWLATATRYTLDALRAMDEPPFAYVLAFAVRFLDAVHDKEPDAPALLAKLAAWVPADGKVAVRGGAEGETLHPLDLAPAPDGAARSLFTREVVEADLDRVAAGQHEDGGWSVDYLKISPAGAMDWRGVATFNAVELLRRNGRG
ncbi:hypothetical protein OIE66_05095 [Nonomuraea sp. NBC_01738]|uniref:hypothetical protein n=1 Tax=Nonomuraea sp. NBC_01738 TaxID=2976003 RepID=UPI002E0E5189|nr:hypothetical protein OIE66_05095 [Nonomuraea sp. NBC_01738]